MATLGQILDREKRAETRRRDSESSQIVRQDSEAASSGGGDPLRQGGGTLVRPADQRAREQLLQQDRIGKVNLQGSMKRGGVARKAGLYRLHKGERVKSKSGTRVSGRK